VSALVELRGMVIRTPERVLVEDVNVTVMPRRVTALVGPSGAGKSLTARSCMCVLDVDPGLQAGTLRYPNRKPSTKGPLATVLYKGVQAALPSIEQLTELSRRLRQGADAATRCSGYLVK